ncbi:MAG: aminopeptidase [Chloroflexaceae bacterium]|jgi:aminopeptidase|nr:aminopeptidase [Chloroflexaceae bacterium]
MADPRVEKLAQVLVHFSLKLKKGELFRISGSAVAAPLIRALYREALLAGANPFTRISLDGLDELTFKYASDEQLTYISPLVQQEAELIDSTISIIADENTKALSGADPARVAKARNARRELQQRVMQRAAENKLNWCVTLFPTNANAQDADMSLSDYEDFVYGAGLLNEADPVAAWQQVEREQQRIADFLATRDTIRLLGPGTDLTYRVGGRTWINAAGDKNFPDGEVFTGPLEDSANGEITYSFPAVYSGREVEGVRLVFKEGKAVEATAAKGQELLLSLLDMDKGARYLGEVAFGLNYGIQRFSRNILFDEKIGGTVHLAVGASYPETGGTNESALHWDMICDMRQDSEVYADGELVYKNGRFII